MMRIDLSMTQVELIIEENIWQHLGETRFLDGFHSRKEKFVDASYANWAGKLLELGKQCCVAHGN